MGKIEAWSFRGLAVFFDRLYQTRVVHPAVTYAGVENCGWGERCDGVHGNGYVAVVKVCSIGTRP